MKMTLILTAPNCFRPPAVMEHVQDVLQTGGSVAMATRDHPDTLPDWPEFTAVDADDWDALSRNPSSLTVLDNLRFRDCRGQVFERWSGAGWEELPVRDIEQLVLGLSHPAESLMLVSGDDAVSGAWRGWLEQHSIGIERHVGHRARYWSMRGRDGQTLRLDGNLLQKRLEPDACRGLDVEIVAPEQETLLAMMAEYTSIRYDYRNPADPRWLNASGEGIREIIGAHAGQANPAFLLEALETLYDFVSEHVDFRQPWPCCTHWFEPMETDEHGQESSIPYRELSGRKNP
ncbi:MAG: hypothetical protein F4X92_00165 [Gammaproteobacteria bacterium]|nr:hypothetical protein [Gammaproteobacteria bacterium]